jgi:hypothetical protein
MWTRGHRFSRLGLTLLTLSTIACACTPGRPAAELPAEASPRPVATAPVPPQAKRTDPVQADPMAKILQLVNSIAQLSELTRPELERLLGAPLLRSPEPGMFVDHTAALSGGPFARVTFREPNSAEAARFWLVSLEVRPDVLLPRELFLRRGIIPKDGTTDVQPDVPPHGLVSYTVHERSAQNIIYDFDGEDGHLTGVAIHRGGNIR